LLIVVICAVVVVIIEAAIVIVVGWLCRRRCSGWRRWRRSDGRRRCDGR
jgi:hypothetical protein